MAVEVVDEEGVVKLRANGKMVGREENVHSKLNFFWRLYRPNDD